jgi:hypothetical protein
MVLKTPFRKEKEAYDMAVYQEYERLAADGRSDKMAINEAVMKKFHIHGISTLYAIRKRVEKRIAQRQ